MKMNTGIKQQQEISGFVKKYYYGYSIHHQNPQNRIPYIIRTAIIEMGIIIFPKIKSAEKCMSNVNSTCERPRTFNSIYFSISLSLEHGM